jgi:glycosyltransferase involved in cell wall biosynthesis
LAVKHCEWVDSYIVVSRHIETELARLLPDRIKHINYLRFPIPDIKCESEKSNFELNIVFVGRSEESKGYPLLPKIENELLRRDVKVKWHIAGEGSNDIKKQRLWDNKSDVIFYGFLSQGDIVKLLCKCQLFILPSIAEGMPVSVIEAMKAGCVPIVNDLQSGVAELVLNDVSGYIVKNNEVCKYADVIEKLSKSNDLVYQMSIGAKARTLNLFDPKINAKLIEDIYFKMNIIQKKLPKKVYGSSLDQRYLPNFVTYSLRKYSKLLKQFF